MIIEPYRIGDLYVDGRNGIHAIETELAAPEAIILAEATEDGGYIDYNFGYDSVRQPKPFAVKFIVDGEGSLSNLHGRVLLVENLIGKKVSFQASRVGGPAGNLIYADVTMQQLRGVRNKTRPETTMILDATFFLWKEFAD